MKIPPNHISDKGLIFKIYKELMELNSKITNNPIQNGQRKISGHDRGTGKHILPPCATIEKNYN